MEVVPTAEFLEGQKERFDLGVFVGDLALHEEAASDDESLEGCGRSSTTARTIRKSRTSWPMASNCESTQKVLRTTYGKSSWIRYRITLNKVKNLVLLHDQIHD